MKAESVSFSFHHILCCPHSACHCYIPHFLSFITYIILMIIISLFILFIFIFTNIFNLYYFIYISHLLLFFITFIIFLAHLLVCLFLLSIFALEYTKARMYLYFLLCLQHCVSKLTPNKMYRILTTQP